MVHIKTFLEINGVEYKIEFDAVNITTVDQGIGAYEYWGAKGNHSEIVVDEYDIENLLINGESPQYLELVKEAIYDSNRIWERINDKYFFV